VQLGDALRTVQTDLTPLFERERRVEERQQKAASGLSTAARRTLGGQTNRDQVLEKKHKSLNALLGTAKGGHGRVVLPQSPYDATHSGVENERQGTPSAKRRRVTEDRMSAQPWRVERIDKVTQSKSLPSWARTADARAAPVPGHVTPEPKKKSAPKSQSRSIAREVIDITSDNEVFPSDVTLPSTPAVVRTESRQTLAAARPQPLGPPSRRKKVQKIFPPLISPPVSTKNRVSDIQSRLDVERTRPDPPSPIHSEAPVPKPKALRLAKPQPRSMLLCQKLVTKKPGPTPVSRSITHEDPWNLSDLEEETALVRSTNGKKSDKAVPIPAKNKAGVLAKRDGLAFTAAQDARDSSSPAFCTMASRAERFEPPPPPSRPPKAPNEPIPPKKRQRKQKVAPPPVDLAMLDQRLMSASSKANSKPPAHTITADAGPSKPSADRPFRRVQSEAIPSFPSMFDDDDADMLFSSNEEVQPPAALTTSISRLNHTTRKITQPRAPTAAATKKRPPEKQPLQRAVSFNQVVGKTNPMSKQVEVEKPLAPKKEVEAGPWTVEATDLFDWRPPDWEERVKKRAEKRL
jgi:hypothetical protein